MARVQGGKDPKQGEREYYQKIGVDGLAHAQRKPFSDGRCAHYLADMGALLMLMRPPPGRVLDLGCGTGWTSLFLARAGYAVTGVDISPEAIAAARETADHEQLTAAEFVVGDYEAVRAAGAYDYVLFYDALHHAEDERAAIACSFAALRPGGALIAFEPGEGHSTSDSSVRAVAEFGVHEKDMPPRRIAALGREAGFRASVFLPTPHEITRTLYRRDFHRAASSGRLWLEKAWGYYRMLWRMATVRRGGMTVLWK